MTNACVAWTTTYLGYAIDDDADPVSTEVIAHPSPACYGHINPYGTYTFNERALRQRTHRPLRPAPRSRWTKLK